MLCGSFQCCADSFNVVRVVSVLCGSFQCCVDRKSEGSSDEQQLE